MVKAFYYDGDSVSKEYQINSNLISVKQIQAATGLCRKTIDNLVKRGVLVKHKIPHTTRVYFLSEEVEQAIPGCRFFTTLPTTDKIAS